MPLWTDVLASVQLWSFGCLSQARICDFRADEQAGALEAFAQAARSYVRSQGRSDKPTISTLSEGQATGEAYTLAHHITVEGQSRRLMLASLRYTDTFVKQDGAWLSSERLLCVDWVDERALS